MLGGSVKRKEGRPFKFPDLMSGQTLDHDLLGIHGCLAA